MSFRNTCAFFIVFTQGRCCPIVALLQTVYKAIHDRAAGRLYQVVHMIAGDNEIIRTRRIDVIVYERTIDAADCVFGEIHSALEDALSSDNQ